MRMRRLHGSGARQDRLVAVENALYSKERLLNFAARVVARAIRRMAPSSLFSSWQNSPSSTISLFAGIGRSVYLPFSTSTASPRIPPTQSSSDVPGGYW